MSLWRKACLALAMLLAGVGTARAEVAVVASIPPVHSLAAMVMAGVGAPSLLVPAGASPHGFALSPSQAKRLSEAAVVFWIGPGLEAPLRRSMETVARKARVVTLADVPGLTLHDLRGAPLFGHDHGAERRDPHVWLDPQNAAAMVGAMAEALTAADPANAARYAANAAAAEVRLRALTDDLARRLAPVKDRPYVVFHDAYQYLEKRFGLAFAGAVALDPDRPAGPRHLAALRDEMARLGVRCLFAEPQFRSSLIEVLRQGTGAHVAILDPLGAGLAPGPDLYFRLLTADAAALVTCLSE